MAYEELLLRIGTDCNEQWGNSAKTSMEGSHAFLAKAASARQVFPILRGWISTVSPGDCYAPLLGHSNHELMMQALRSLYRQFAGDGLVTIHYQAYVSWGLIHAVLPQRGS